MTAWHAGYSRLDEEILHSTKKSRLEEKILDSAKIFSTRGKNSLLDDKILDSIKIKFSTRKKNLDHFCPLRLAI